MSAFKQWISVLDKMQPHERIRDIMQVMPEPVVARINEMAEPLAIDEELMEQELHEFIRCGLEDVEDWDTFTSTDRREAREFMIMCGIYEEMSEHEMKNTTVTAARSRKVWDLKLGGKYYAFRSWKPLEILAANLNMKSWLEVM